MRHKKPGLRKRKINEMGRPWVAARANIVGGERARARLCCRSARVGRRGTCRTEVACDRGFLPRRAELPLLLPRMAPSTVGLKASSSSRGHFEHTLIIKDVHCFKENTEPKGTHHLKYSQGNPEAAASPTGNVAQRLSHLGLCAAWKPRGGGLESGRVARRRGRLGRCAVWSGLRWARSAPHAALPPACP